MTALLRAEVTKASSIGLLWWTVGLALVVPVVVAGLLAAAMGSREAFCENPGNTCRNELEHPGEVVSTIGVLGDGIPGGLMTILTMFAAFVLLAEIRYSTLSTAFVVTSRRHRVTVAKMVLIAALCLPVSLVATLASGVVFDFLAGSAGSAVQPWSGAAFNVAFRSALMVSAFALMAFAVAALTRNIWVTLTLVLAWPNLIEYLLPAVLPGGENLAGFLPLMNARHFVGLEGGTFIWSPMISGVYVAVLTALLSGLGLWRLSKADLPRNS